MSHSQFGRRSLAELSGKTFKRLDSFLEHALGRDRRTGQSGKPTRPLSASEFQDLLRRTSQATRLEAAPGSKEQASTSPA